VSTSKIALFSDSLQRGGAQRVMVTLASAFSEEGFDVDLILIKKEGFYRNELDKRVKILDLNKGNISSSFLSLARYLRNSKPSFLITSMDHLHIVAWIAKIISGSSVKLIFRMPTTATYLYNNIRLSYLGFKYLIMFLVVRILYKNYPLIVSSKEIKEEYVDFYKLNPQKVFVIPNPIDTDFIRKKSKEEINLGKLKRPSITAIGRLMRDKDFITIIDAFKLLTETIDANLYILGIGPDQEKIENYIKKLGIEENVFLTGFVENPFSFLANSDVYVLSSFIEGMPNTLLHAICLDVPVVSTDTKYGPRTILEDGKWGYLVDIGDAQGMCKGIMKGINQELEKMPLELFDKKYNKQQVTKSYKQLFIS